jgi:hypothetical protein
MVLDRLPLSSLLAKGPDGIHLVVEDKELPG